VANSRTSNARAKEFHPAFEEYCEAIWELREDEIEVIQARIAERLEVSRPAVSEMIRRMEGEGLITVGPRIELTADGLALAERVVRRHRIAERFLTDVLGLSWADAHVEAGKWEHVISEPVEAALVRVLGEPTTCPHGNPIPGAGWTAPATRALNEVTVGSTFTVSRIPEELEFSPGMLDYLEEHALLPGRTGVLVALSPAGTATVEVDGRPFSVEPFASERILVTA
jgi:DtxR family transcriptional regulator, Mn-dependent transcriptional regulator